MQSGILQVDDDQNRFTIELPVFSGPLDLLLHLVQKEQVSIWDVSLAKVTEEYLRFLDTMQELNLEVTCEFLVLAATLVQIKARSLLPKPPAVADETEDETEESLLLRLVEYKKFKTAAEQFARRAEQENEVFTKVYLDVNLLAQEDQPATTGEINVSIWELLEIVQKLLATYRPEPEAKPEPQIPREFVSLPETIFRLQQRFQGGYRCGFRDLLLEARSRAELIATFLACLELIKLGFVSLVRSETSTIELVSEG
ncbi:MAG: segregation/condensation protein A [Firmicutes bacterium]|nr:segregation/condensation protein A [Bacillota bacterium]